MNLLYANDAKGVDAPSYYAATSAKRDERPALLGEASADVCVVGGGYTGLSAALHLAERGYKVALLEAHRVGWGASGRNGGQVGSGQRADQQTLEEMVGPDDAMRLWRLAEEAKALVKALVAKHRIECDMTPGIVEAIHRRRLLPEARAAVDHMAEVYGYETTYLEGDDARKVIDSPAYCGLMIDDGAAHLHPLNYALGLARAASAAGASIYELSEVAALETNGSRTIVRTAQGEVRADHVVLACNGYLGALSGEVAARVMPINNFIIATEPLDEWRAERLIAKNRAVADSKFVVNYFRFSADRRLLFGGGESYGYDFPQDIKGFVRRAMLDIFPELTDARIDYGWGGTLAITMNRMPHFARLGGGVFSCSGYSGHGVAMATLAGALAAEAVAGEAERFDLMASVPSPRFPGGPSMRAPLLALAMLWYRLRDKL